MSRATLVGVALVYSIVGALRFVGIEADFPDGISASGDLYTDEGWYTSAALSSSLSGRWYTPGDFNPIVNMPVFPVLQSAVFGVAGPSLAAARGTVAVSFLVLVVLAARLLWRTYGAGVAVLALTLLLTNFTLFAYSRFAIVESPMLTFALATVVLLRDDALPRPKVGVAAVCLALALLTKTTAVFVLPVVAYLIATSATTWRQKRVAFGIVGAGLIAAALYHALAYTFFTQDYVYFNTRNIAERVRFDPVGVFLNLDNALDQLRATDRVAYSTFVLAPLVLVTLLRRSRIAVMVAVWFGSYLGLLALTGYHPARYMLPLVVPALLLLAVAVGTLWTRYGQRWARGIVALLVGGVVIFESVRVVGYLRAPQYSYRDMTRNIAARIARSEQPNGVLMGDIANTISLATGQPSINARWGTQSVAWKLARYRPAFYVSLGDDAEVEAIIEADHDLTLLAVYDVFDNYYGGERVRFYAIQPPANDE